MKGLVPQTTIDGDDTSTKCYLFNLIHHSTQGDFTHSAYTYHEDIVSTKSSRKGPETCATGITSLNQLDLNERWSLLVLRLMRKFLEACGHSVFCYTNIPQVFFISFSSLQTVQALTKPNYLVNLHVSKAPFTNPDYIEPGWNAH